MAVYVDASAWIALRDDSEHDHAAAKTMLRRLRAENETLVAGWHTIYEVADGVSNWFGQEQGAQAVRSLSATPYLRIQASEPHIAAAVDLLESRPSWKVDFSDCLSFVMMRELGIRRAFTFDADFKKAGFEVVP